MAACTFPRPDPTEAGAVGEQWPTAFRLPSCDGDCRGIGIVPEPDGVAVRQGNSWRQTSIIGSIGKGVVNQASAQNRRWLAVFEALRNDEPGDGLLALDMMPVVASLTDNALGG
ncbi:MAG: hypothetical protein ACK5YI_14390 [Rhodospirillales bacterium]